MHGAQFALTPIRNVIKQAEAVQSHFPRHYQPQELFLTFTNLQKTTSPSLSSRNRITASGPPYPSGAEQSRDLLKSRLGYFEVALAIRAISADWFFFSLPF